MTVCDTVVLGKLEFLEQRDKCCKVSTQHVYLHAFRLLNLVLTNMNNTNIFEC